MTVWGLKDTSAESNLQYRIYAQPIHELRDAVICFLVYHLVEVADAVSIYHRFALELCAKLNPGTKALLGDKAAITQAEVWAEAVHLDAATHITILVNRNLVIANLDIILLALSDILLQLVAMTGDLDQFVTTHRKTCRYEKRIGFAKRIAIYLEVKSSARELALHVHGLTIINTLNRARHISCGIDVDVWHHVETYAGLHIFSDRHCHVDADTLGTDAHTCTYTICYTEKVTVLC